MFIEHNIIMYKITHTIKTLQIKSALHTAAALYREHIYNRDSHGNFYIHGIRSKNEFPSIFFIALQQVRHSWCMSTPLSPPSVYADDSWISYMDIS